MYVAGDGDVTRAESQANVQLLCRVTSSARVSQRTPRLHVLPPREDLPHRRTNLTEASQLQLQQKTLPPIEKGGREGGREGLAVRLTAATRRLQTDAELARSLAGAPRTVSNLHSIAAPVVSENGRRQARARRWWRASRAGA